MYFVFKVQGLKTSFGATGTYLSQKPPGITPNDCSECTTHLEGTIDFVSPFLDLEPLSPRALNP